MELSMIENDHSKEMLFDHFCCYMNIEPTEVIRKAYFDGYDGGLEKAAQVCDKRAVRSYLSVEKSLASEIRKVMENNG